MEELKKTQKEQSEKVETKKKKWINYKNQKRNFYLEKKQKNKLK